MTEEYSVCGCDDNGNQTYYDSLVAANQSNTTQFANVNGSMHLVINGYVYSICAHQDTCTNVSAEHFQMEQLHPVVQTLVLHKPCWRTLDSAGWLVSSPIWYLQHKDTTIQTYETVRRLSFVLGWFNLLFISSSGPFNVYDSMTLFLCSLNSISWGSSHCIPHSRVSVSTLMEDGFWSLCFFFLSKVFWCLVVAFPSRVYD